MTTRVVGLLADPDTPADVAARLVDELPDALAQQRRRLGQDQGDENAAG